MTPFFDGLNLRLIHQALKYVQNKNTDKNEISFGTISHKLNTGDKIAYSADLLPEGISTSSYYVYKVDDNTIKLCCKDSCEIKHILISVFISLFIS